jgi:hypothetical protein
MSSITMKTPEKYVYNSPYLNALPKILAWAQRHDVQLGKYFDPAWLLTRHGNPGYAGHCSYLDHPLYFRETTSPYRPALIVAFPYWRPGGPDFDNDYQRALNDGWSIDFLGEHWYGNASTATGLIFKPKAQQ